MKEKRNTILTVRATSGLSGDIMLGGLAALAELSEDELDLLVGELNMPELMGTLKVKTRVVQHISGVGCSIALPKEHEHRNLKDIESIIKKSSMPAEACELSVQAFTILAKAEASVHAKPIKDVHFHEVGALDSILDVCMVCRIFTLLKPNIFVCSPLPLADGAIHCAHGAIPCPAPAVLHMLEGITVCGFSGQGETVTPTALSLLKALGASFDVWPHMTVQRSIISYGTKIFPHIPNGAIWSIGLAPAENEECKIASYNKLDS